MGGGDLNMKKSWHPLLIKNQERVWKEEQKALEEQKKLAQLKKEKEEERQLQELRKLQEVAGGRKGPERLDWMYAAGPNQSSSAKAQELEDFLLGKRRVDKIVDQGISVNKLSVDSKDIFISAMNPNANSYRDTQSKIREDPLLLIKKTEQANIKAIVTNPIKMKELKKKTKKDKKDKKASKKHEAEAYSDHKHSKGSEKHQYKKSSSDDDHSETRRKPDKYDRLTKRQRSINMSRSRSRDRYANRQYLESPRSNEYDNRRDNYERRNENPHSYVRRRSISPPRKRERRSSPYSCHRKSGNTGPDSKTMNGVQLQKLQEMMNDAKKLAEDRKKRVEEVNTEEAEEEKKITEDKKRTIERGMHSAYLKEAYKDVYSSSSSFDLGERVRRHRSTLQKVVGE